MLPIGGSLLLAGCNSSSDDDDDAVPAKPQPQPQPALASTFALAVLPDTQFYSRYATDAENQQFMRKYGSEPFQAQTRWVAQHAAALNIRSWRTWATWSTSRQAGPVEGGQRRDEGAGGRQGALLHPGGQP